MARAFGRTAILTAIRDSTGEITGFAKVTRDFTDRKRAEEAIMLQLSTALLANMDVRRLLGGDFGQHRRADSARLRDAGALRFGDRWADRALSQRRPGDPQRGEVRVCRWRHSPAGQAFRTREPVVLDRMDGS